VTRDDFGIKNMLAVINARAREPISKQATFAFGGSTKRDMVEEKLFGVGGGGVKGHASAGRELRGRFDEFDRELDRLLEGVLGLGKSATV